MNRSEMSEELGEAMAAFEKPPLGKAVPPCATCGRYDARGSCDGAAMPEAWRSDGCWRPVGALKPWNEEVE